MPEVFIHADADGTYLGNGGFIMLNELGVQLGRMGYAVRWFDHRDRLLPSMWDWTGYDVPHLASFDTVKYQGAPIVTTWLYSWLDTLTQFPALFPRLRYWCSGELLRDEPRYDASRAFVRAHVGEIAINNPSLAKWYEGLGITPRWQWTNWVRELFQPAPERREAGLIGYQPDGDDSVEIWLRAECGETGVLACIGTQREVAQKLQRCDYFIAWNDHWPMVCGPGESFGLNTFEAMACGCIVVARRHSGNEHLINDRVYLQNNLSSAIDLLRLYRAESEWHLPRSIHLKLIETRFRFDDARRQAIRGYLNG